MTAEQIRQARDLLTLPGNSISSVGLAVVIIAPTAGEHAAARCSAPWSAPPCTRSTSGTCCPLL